MSFLKLGRKSTFLIKILFVLIFLNARYFIPLQDSIIHVKSSPINAYNLDEAQMLVFVSPQYSGDVSILQAIEEYAAAVEDDVGWKIKIVKLTNTTNTVGYIRHVI